MKALFLPLLVSACAMNGASPPVAEACDSAPANELIGKPHDAATADRALKLTGARHLRLVRPGMMVTMDYRADRLTVHLDDDGKIERISCG